MPRRADAHIHLFRPGYVGTYPKGAAAFNPTS